MKIWTLIENTTCREDLTAEHGLSLYIETGNLKLLFDTGKTGAFADNAEKLGIDLTQVDLCILSHGHYDHGGGLARFLEINDKAPVYIQREAFAPHFSSGRDIGLNPGLLKSDRLIWVDDNCTIAEGISLRTCNRLPRPCPFDVFGQTREEKGVLLPENYHHEQYLLVEEGEKKICVSGCSHKGIANILHWFQPDVLIGGFHFIKIAPEDPLLADYARQLLAHSTRYYTCHCTGQAQYAALKEVLGTQLQYLCTGSFLAL